MSRRALPADWAVALVAVWIALPANAALWRKLSGLGALSGPGGWTLALAMFVFVAAGIAALLCLFAWPKLLKPAAAALLLGAAVACHFMLSFGVVMDPGMLTNALQTDTHEVGGLLGWRLAATVALLAVAPAAALARQPVSFGTARRRLARNALGLAAALALLVASVLAAFQPMAALMHNHKDIRYMINPWAGLYSLGRVAARPWQRGDGGPLVQVGADAHLKEDAGAAHRPTILLLVLGETARADHFGINGYGRDTTPELAARGVLSFRQAWSCGTSTAASVPCMFSNLTREGFDAGKGRREGLLDVLQRAGLAVLWIDNQSGCKGVCDRVPNVNTREGDDPVLCPSGECLDEVMLKGLDERIAALDPRRAERGIVVVMHQMGSHGPAYHLRSPPDAKRFSPECATSALNECPHESLVNAYDNSIAYTDRFLGRAIDWLHARADTADTALLYVSDHGESLGEGNLYLHGLPYALAPDVQKRVPWVTWLSEGYQRGKGLSAQCVGQARDTPVSHDNYFHSVLGLMAVKTTAYSEALDAYAGCRDQPSGGLVARGAGGGAVLGPPLSRRPG